MSAIKRVLFPVDLSSNYRTLSPATRKMFDRRSTGIVMLHAIEEPSRSARGMDVARSMAQMEFLARQEFEFAEITRRVERGRAAHCILDYVRNHEVDVIVMPARDPDSLGCGSLGHVTDEILAGSPVSIWTEPLSARKVKSSVENVRHICCAIGLDSSDDAVLCRAAEVAREFDAELTIIHAVVPGSPMALWWDADALEQDARIARMRVEELREQFAPAARLHVEAGRLDWVVSQALSRLNAGLLVAAGRGTATVAGAVACPVLRIATLSKKTAHASRPDRILRAATA